MNDTKRARVVTASTCSITNVDAHLNNVRAAINEHLRRYPDDVITITVHANRGPDKVEGLRPIME